MMNKLRLFIVNFLVITLTTSGSGRNKPKNIIIFTCDGLDVKERAVSGAFTTRGHSAVMVPVFANGPGSDSFTGVRDNTELFKDFKRLLSLGTKQA
jgi:alkaline phosphatase